MQGNRIVGLSPKSVNPVVPLYNPTIHKIGDRVMVRQGNRLIETVIPDLDADGNVIP